jgi:hypothetical protein
VRGFSTIFLLPGTRVVLIFTSEHRHKMSTKTLQFINMWKSIIRFQKSTVEQKCKFFLQIRHRFRVTTFYHWCRSYYCECQFETIRFNMICQPSSLFAMKERNSALSSIFNRRFILLIISAFLIFWLGLVRLVTTTTIRVCYVSTVYASTSCQHGISSKRSQ